MSTYDNKINRTIEFQLGHDSNYMVHFNRFNWDDNPLPQSECELTKSKSYRNVTKSSLSRLSRVINNATYDKRGKLELWVSSLGWRFNDFGNEVAK